MSLWQMLMWIGVGLAALVLGGEWLVRGATRLAVLARISPLVIGLTVVAFGTSAPELAVSVQATWTGRPDVAIGNIIGSNICNILLVLGASALIRPILVSSQLIRLDVPLMIAASVAVLLFALDGAIERWEGGVLFAALVIYLAWLLVTSRREAPEIVSEFTSLVPTEPGRPSRGLAVSLVLIVLGLILLTLGSHWLVTGAAELARLLGVSELIIGLTVIALGTSLPEVAASLVAALRGARDIAVGNLVGSNIFNLLAILGITALVAPEPIAVSAQALRQDLPIMLLVAFACLPIFFTGQLISRWDGGIFLFYYGAYTAFLVLDGLRAPARDPLMWAILLVALPATVIFLAVTTWRQWRK